MAGIEVGSGPNSSGPAHVVGSSGAEPGHGDQPEGRRALVRSAMDGMNRFKQSWVSVMLLKAGIGLGQFAALLVLLILSCDIASPLDASRTQSQPSPQCPHPRLFRSWMWVQIVRLFTCWAVSCWIVVRAEKARRARARRESLEAGESHAASAEDLTEARANTDRLELQTRLTSARQPSLSHSATTTPGSECPPMLLSCASPALGQSASEKDVRQHGLAELDDLGISSAQYDSSAILVPTEIAEERDEQDRDGIRHAQRTHAPRLPMVSHRSNQSLRGARRLAQQRLHPELPLTPASPTRSVNGDADDPDAQRDESEKGWRAKVAAVFDKYALTASRCLGVISLILFVLGNVLLFHPPPSQDTCYGASPLLWWGVMLVVGIGYILFAQIFFVVIIVGLGGSVVLESLRRAGLLPGPPAPEPPRPPQPDPLTPAQVAQIPILSYVPQGRPTIETPTLSAEKQLFNDSAQLESASEWGNPRYDTSRLPYPPIYLAPHTSESTCVICQESYVAPREERAILYKVDRLKRLGCGHVYHMDCIDEWLLKGSGNCPACNRPVVIEPVSGANASSERLSAAGQDARRGSSRLPISASAGQEAGRRRSSAMTLLRGAAR